MSKIFNIHESGKLMKELHHNWLHCSYQFVKTSKHVACQVTHCQSLQGEWVGA